MTDRYENIRRALEMGPTPGPWKAHDQSKSGWADITHSTYATPLCYAVPFSDYQYDAELDCERLVNRAHETPANAAHIAACDPDTIRALLAERDALAADAHDQAVSGDHNLVPSLQAEIESLRKDAERYRQAMVEVMRQVDGNIRETVRACVNGGHDVQDIYDYCDLIEEAIGAALAAKEGE